MYTILLYIVMDGCTSYGGDYMYLIPKQREIEKRRKAIGLSRQRLSIKANLPGNALCRLEAGTVRKTNHLRAREIARALDCDVKDIFTETRKSKEDTV